jgi:transposase-like protein
MSLQTRETVEKEIMRFHVKTGLPVEILLKYAGVSKRTWHEWTLRRRIETAEMKKKGFDQPTRVHEQWHIDFSYVKIAGSFYYFLGLLDGYSRKMLVWKLCETMEGVNAEVLVTKAKELYPEAKNPRIISDT